MNVFRRKQKREQTRTDYGLILDTYGRQLMSYVARITGSGSAAEDVVQETFVKFSQHWRGEIAPGPAVSAWLYKTAHNTAIDLIRREKTRRESDERHYREREINGENNAPDSLPETAASASAVRKALASLSERERSLVVLKIYENKSYREIGEITGLKIGNIGFILHTAMKKLAKSISFDKEGEGR